MRIQHNIMAMNSYRNFSNNTKAVGKNLEKLSSGYRINNAGDDAAGLAVSEKMRAQITGLKTAQKNAKDGISLVKTAEGALTEVHSMLNRMVDLAGQSANGTYDNEVDRANLQKEVDALKEEVNRIADSSNFNGIKLLDGTQAAKGAAAAGVPSVKGLTLTDTDATAKVATIATTAITGGLTAGKVVSYSFSDKSGKTTSIDLTVNTAGDKLVAADGSEYVITGGGAATATHLGDALRGELAKAGLSEKYTIGGSAGNITFTSKDKGSDAAEMLVMNGPDATVANQVNTAASVTGGADAFQSGKPVLDKEFSVGGKKFMFVDTADKAAAAGKGVNVVVTAGAGAIAHADLKEMASIIEKETGYKPTLNHATAADGFDFKANASANAATAKGGLTLQIGDTAESFNQMKVSIGDMHAKALGIDGVDISTQEGGAAAMESIKNAINTVSSTRGDLGALQNRLDHTINNLSVMHENIQDAEATIRDTDVADEMMAYTKNNILVQSAQAMLAQANQVPQGVLQLLG